MKLLPLLYCKVSFAVALCFTPAAQTADAQSSLPILTPPEPVTTINVPHSVQLKPFRDPWPSNRERWLDVSDSAERQFDAFVGARRETKQTFSYGNAQVTLTYDQAPTNPFFVAKINATGLNRIFAIN